MSFQTKYFLRETNSTNFHHLYPLILSQQYTFPINPSNFIPILTNDKKILQLISKFCFLKRSSLQFPYQMYLLKIVSINHHRFYIKCYEKNKSYFSIEAKDVIANFITFSAFHISLSLKFLQLQVFFLYFTFYGHTWIQFFLSPSTF